MRDGAGLIIPVHANLRQFLEGLPLLLEVWRRDEARSAEGFAWDRSGIYGGFHCYDRRVRTRGLSSRLGCWLQLPVVDDPESRSGVVLPE